MAGGDPAETNKCSRVRQYQRRFRMGSNHPILVLVHRERMLFGGTLANKAMAIPRSHSVSRHNADSRSTGPGGLRGRKIVFQQHANSRRSCGFCRPVFVDSSLIVDRCSRIRGLSNRPPKFRDFCLRSILEWLQYGGPSIQSPAGCPHSFLKYGVRRKLN